MNKCPWRKIESAPQGQYVEVCGDSGYSSQRWYIALAKFDHARIVSDNMSKQHSSNWLDVTGCRLSDTFPAPVLYWRHASHFPMQDPDPDYERKNRN